VTAELPPALQAALDRALDGRGRAGLAERAARTSETYRAGQASAGVIRDADDALAYALTRLPATYAACRAVFASARRAAPGFAPTRLLDVGAGPGTAGWAAAEVWPELTSATWLEANPAFAALARELAANGPWALRAATLRPATFRQMSRCHLRTSWSPAICWRRSPRRNKPRW
jgi:ribosomal protein RSM22 (predicted rRNA methylase)